MGLHPLLLFVDTSRENWESETTVTGGLVRLVLDRGELFSMP